MIHAFVRNDDGRVTSFDAPGAGTAKGQGTLTFSINSAGAITGPYIDGNGANHGYVRPGQEHD